MATEASHAGAVVPILPPNAPFAELLRLSKSSVTEEHYAERSGNRWVNE
jgi:hypothetical protein